MAARSIQRRLCKAARLIVSVFFVSVSGVVVPERAAGAAPPNVLFIVADDLGYSDVGFQGSPDIRTPNIDALAASGIVMRQGYASASVCSPSRAGYMTGRYPQRFGYENNIQGATLDPDIGLPVEEVTLGDVFKKAGYTTGIIGKWHLGAAPAYHPNVRGFDYFFGTLATPSSYFDAKPTSVNKLQRNGVAAPLNGYLTDALAEDAAAFIDRNRDRPFFLYVAFNAPHIPLQAPDGYLSRYPDLSGNRRVFAAMVSALDDGVGRIMAKIESLSRQTVVVFISDNGGPVANGATNTPLRGAKGSTWEGGLRVPFVIRIPGMGHKVYPRPVVTRDLMPTFAALAGTTAPPGLDGVNLLPYLRGEKTGDPHAYLFWRMHGSAANAARNRSLKTVQPTTGARQTFNIETDRREITARGERALLDAYQRWSAEMMPPRW